MRCRKKLLWTVLRILRGCLNGSENSRLISRLIRALRWALEKRSCAGGFVKFRMTLIAGLALFALLLGVQSSPAQGTTGPGTLPQTAMPSAIHVPAAAQPSDHFDVEAATDAYLAEIPTNARAKSDAYFEGGYWLILWDFIYGVALYILLLHFGWSVGMRNFAERITRFKPLQTFIYWAEFLVLATVMSAP